VTVLYGVQPSRRRDAQRNRLAIVEAASEVMTSHESVILMPEIARRAGVSQATLYRHFGDRPTLVGAVISYQLNRLERCAAASHPAGFRDLLDAVLHWQIAMRPLVRLERDLDARTRVRYRQRLVAALTAPLHRARDHGYVRADFTPSDLELLLAMTRDMDEEPDRAIGLLLDGVFGR
jgi:AcrR family transcriptional regulator